MIAPRPGYTASVTNGRIGNRRWAQSCWLDAQEQGEAPPRAPDIERPPDQDLPDVGTDVTDVPDGPGIPPFTNEDLEDEEPKQKDPPPM
jgi:hypothetical protein